MANKRWALEDKLKWLNRYADFKQKHPSDFVNETTMYDPGPEPGTSGTEHLLALTKARVLIALEGAEGMDVAYLRQAITNGDLMFELVRRNEKKIREATKARYGEAFLTTQTLGRYLPKETRELEAAAPNKQKNLDAAQMAERSFPDHAIFSPFDSEGIVITQKKEHAMSQSAVLQDWAFEMFYIAFLRMKAKEMVTGIPFIMDGDGVYSRNGAPEDIEAEVQHFGFFYDFLQGKNAGFFDINGNEVPLFDRLWEGSKHIFDVVEDGFRVDFATTRLLTQFMYYDWLKDGHHKLDKKHVHPSLQKLMGDSNKAKGERARIEKLRTFIMPYLAEKCLDWTPFDKDPDLNAYVETEVLKHKGHLKPIEEIRKELFRYIPMGGYRAAKKQEAFPGAKDASREKWLARNAFRGANETIKRRGPDLNAFEGQKPFFDDHYFKRLSTSREQAALKIAINSLLFKIMSLNYV